MLNARKVRRLRREQKMTQEVLADLAHTTIQTISHIENGHRRNIYTDLLEGLAKALNVEPADLLR